MVAHFQVMKEIYPSEKIIEVLYRDIIVFFNSWGQIINKNLFKGSR